MKKENAQSFRTKGETAAILALIGVRPVDLATLTGENQTSILKVLSGQRDISKVKTKISEAVAAKAAEFMMRPLV